MIIPLKKSSTASLNKLFMRSQNSLLDDLHSPHNINLSKQLQDPESPLNQKFQVSKISYYYQFYLAFLVILYSLLQLAVTWSIFDIKQSDLGFKIYPIFVLLLFLSLWNKKSANTFSSRIPVVCLTGHILCLVFPLAQKNQFYQFLGYCFLICFISMIIFCPVIEQFRKSQQNTRTIWSLSLLLMLSRFKFYPELSDGSNIVILQFLFACELLAAFTEILRHKIINLKQNKQEYIQFVRRQILYSHLFKIIFLPHYTNVPSLLLIALIVITCLQIKFLLKQKNIFIIEDVIKTGTIAYRKYSNSIQFVSLCGLNQKPYLKSLQINNKNCVQDQLCSICHTQTVSFALQQCQHLVYCLKCGKREYQKHLKSSITALRNHIKCPICRMLVKCDKILDIISISRFLENKIDLVGRQSDQNYFYFKENQGGLV